MDDLLGSHGARALAARAMTMAGPPMADTFLHVHDLTKRFGEHVAVHGLSVEVPRGQVLALLGPSGSGKTTTLRLLAGFERPDAGTITVDGRDVTALPPAARRFGMVFQNYALFPHLDVAGNVGFGLSDVGEDERRQRVARALDLVDLKGFERRQVGALSGGQQQRVAVARALAPEPRVLLLDEPLSNLDPSLRERTRRELKTALERTGITTVFVTHEQEEAFALGDLIAVLNVGVLEQIGTATELYEAPATLFVATFVGRASVLGGTVIGSGKVRIAAREGAERTMEGAERSIVGDERAMEGDERAMEDDERAMEDDEIVWTADGVEGLPPGTPVRVVVRPEALRFTDGSGVPGTVTERRYVGARAFFRVEGPAGVLEVEAPLDAAQVDTRVRVTAVRARAFRDAPAGKGA